MGLESGLDGLRIGVPESLESLAFLLLCLSSSSSEMISLVGAVVFEKDCLHNYSINQYRLVAHLFLQTIAFHPVVFLHRPRRKLLSQLAAHLPHYCVHIVLLLLAQVHQRIRRTRRLKTRGNVAVQLLQVKRQIF